VDADLGLSGGDLRAAERSFQQIQQVAGRAGRGDKPGRVFVQTHEPDAPVIAALVSGDVPGFYAAETEARREAAMPPLGRLASIRTASFRNRCQSKGLHAPAALIRSACRRGGFMRGLLACWVAAIIANLGMPAHAAWNRASSKHFVIFADESPKALLDFATRLE